MLIQGERDLSLQPEKKAEQFPSLRHPPPPACERPGGFSLPCPPPLPEAVEAAWPRFLFGVEKSKEEA